MPQKVNPNVNCLLIVHSGTSDFNVENPVLATLSQFVLPHFTTFY